MTSKNIIKHWFNNLLDQFPFHNEELKKHRNQITKDLNKLEKLEKVIKIIYTKYVAINFLLNTLCLKEYNLAVLKENELTEEEYELLKEVFNNEEIF